MLHLLGGENKIEINESVCPPLVIYDFSKNGFAQIRYKRVVDVLFLCANHLIFIKNCKM